MNGYFFSLVFCLTAFLTVPVFGAPQLIEPGSGKTNLTPLSRVLEDPSGKLTIAEVMRPPWAGRFTTQGGNSNNLGLTRSAFWIRLDLEFPAAYTGRYLLEVPYPPLDELTAYLPAGEGGLRVVETGDSKPFSQRDLEHHNFLFQLPPELQGRGKIYLRVANQGAIVAPVYLWEEQAFFQSGQTELLVAGLYFGVLIALAVFNLFIYFSVRDASYLWYVGYLSGIGMFLFIYEGLAFRFFWPDFPGWGNYSLHLSAAVALFGGLGFARTMLNLHILAPRLGRLIFWVGWGMLLYPLIGLFTDKYTMVVMLPYLGLLTLALSAVAITLSILAGYKPARFVGLAFIALIPGGLMLPLRTLGLMPDNALTANSFQIGVAIEALLLSFALAYRIRLLNAKIAQSHQSIVEVKKDFSRRLLEARDNELRRTASELHDGIGQNLLVVSNRLRGLHKQAGDILPKDKFRFLIDIVQETINDIRGMSHRLHPHQLERLGLKTALEEMIKQSFEGTAIQVNYQIDDLQDIADPNMKLHIYRIIQEAIKNIAIHSNANRAYIEIKHYSAEVDIWIEDNGDGVDKNTHIDDAQSPSFGIASIKERVQLMNGKLEFKSTNKSGLVISATLPIPQ